MNKRFSKINNKFNFGPNVKMNGRKFFANLILNGFQAGGVAFFENDEKYMNFLKNFIVRFSEKTVFLPSKGL